MALGYPTDMTHDLPLDMESMNRVFDVVDDLEISRERVQVELLPAGGGSVERLASGRLGVILPADRALTDWLPRLRQRLTELATEEDRE